MQTGTNAVTDPILRIRNLWKTYRTGDCDTIAVRDVSFDVEPGELLLIIGESGCGKTTLLNLIGGMDCPDSGEILFGSTPVSSASRKELTEYRRHNVGFVFQNHHLIPNLTVRDNLEIVAELVKNPLSTEEVLSMTGLSEKAGCFPFQLSGGQQQRVAVARALIKRPKLLLADEPTAALDCRNGKEVLAAFEVAREQGTTVIMITHNEEITKMASRVLKMKNGSIVKIRKNDAVFRASDLEW